MSKTLWINRNQVKPLITIIYSIQTKNSSTNRRCSTKSKLRRCFWIESRQIRAGQSAYQLKMLMVFSCDSSLLIVLIKVTMVTTYQPMAQGSFGRSLLEFLSAFLGVAVIVLAVGGMFV